jgi:uncharacterized protein YjiS (DUF1127 family)
MINKHNMNLALADLSVCSAATPTQAGPRRLILSLPSHLAGLLKLVASWKLRQKTRNQLACATAEVLRDVGISESQRLIEVNKSFWEA